MFRWIKSAMSESSPTSTRAKPRPRKEFSFIPAAPIKSAISMKAPPRWTGWRRKKSAASPSCLRRQPPFGTTSASTSSTLRATSTLPPRSRGHSESWTEALLSLTPRKASSPSRKPSGDRPINTKCHEFASSIKWTSWEPTLTLPLTKSGIG